MRTLVRSIVSYSLLCVAAAVPAFANCDNPTVVGPTNGSTVTPNSSETVVLKWTSQVAAAQYDIYFGPVGSGCNVTPHATVSASTTQWSPPSNEIFPSTQYEWRVVATGAGLTSCPTPPQTACSTFTTASCPAAPVLSSPGNGATVSFGNVVLDWNNVPNATSYEVYVSLDGDPMVSKGTTTQSVKSISVEPGRTIEWKVVAQAPSCSGVPSAHSTFTTSCPTAPANQNAPAPGASVAEGDDVTFSWSVVAGATSYDVKVSADNGGSWEILGENIVGNSYVSDDLTEGTYLWEVRTNFDGDCDPLYSSTRQLIVTASCDHPNPTLISPAANATSALPVTFQWTAVPDATSYRVYAQHATENSFQLVGSSTTTSLTSSDLQAGRNRWKVVARLTGCPDVDSSERVLNIESNCPTAKTVLLAPANGATNVANDVQFRWSAVANARLYRLYASVGGGAETEIASTQNTEASVSLASGASVSWNVRAIFDNDCSTRSDTRSFTTAESNGACPSNPGSATLLSPAPDAGNLASPLLFQWTAVPNAIGYRLLASFNNAAPISLGETTATQLSAAVPAGSGSWIVQAIFGESCSTTLSDRRNFTVTVGATCNDAVPQLLVPANGASTVSTAVTFQWSALPNATSYRLFVAAGNDDFSFYGETNATSLQRLVPAGSVKWFVIARSAACPEARSGVSQFVAGDANSCADAQITLHAPGANASVTSPVQMSWSAVAGASFYRVWISVDGKAPVNILRTEATQAEVPLPAGRITWYVDAQRTNCPAVVSPSREFTVQQAAGCANNAAPALIAPVGTRENPASGTTPVTLTWTAVPNAIGYRVWLSSDLVSFEDVTLTKNTHVELELDAGTYAWYAEAYFGGCEPRASATAYFRISGDETRCPSDAPAILSPAQGAHLTSPVTITWSAVEGAAKYRVFVSIDGSEPLLVGITTETELARPLPPGNAVVAVEAVFRECPSTLSTRVAFTIDAAQSCSNESATLVSPANNAASVSSPVDFVWNAVSGAVKYVLVVQVNDGAPTAIASTEDTHALREVPAGTIRWHVVTFFAGCDPTQSQTFRFTIARDASCETRKPIVLLPTDDDPVPSPVHFQWTPVPNATKYLLWARRGDGAANIIASVTEARADVELPEGRYEYYVEADFAGSCPSTQSARADVEVVAAVACGRPAKPKTQVVGQALSNSQYRVRWTPLSNVQFYEVQESTSLHFANAKTFTTETPSLSFMHEVTGTAAVQYLYRVRGVSDCSEDRGAYSEAVGVFITPPRTTSSSAEIGTANTIVQTVFLPGSTAPLQFSVTSDKPWITVTPSSGTLPIEGLTLTVTSAAGALNLGTNTGTIQITYGGAATGGIASEAGILTSIPFSVSLVTPVVPVGKGTPPPDALIFPVVGHAQGANDSLFESDIRVTNLTAQTMRYDLHFTPSNTNGTESGRSSSIEIAPNATLALDDIVANLFGGTASASTGTLEVRPQTTTNNANVGFFASTSAGSLVRELATAASSRTYNFTPNGTFGQYIPAVRFADFVGKAASGQPPTILSLQQVAQSDAYRANFGFAEGAGSPVELLVRVFNTQNELLKSIPVSLQAGEHRQLNGMLATNGITNLADGRVEVEVMSGDGKVTAYVSEVDNRTNDPLLVSAVVKGAVNANKYVLPGVAYLNNGAAFWVTDVRIFNAGTTETPATLTFYPDRNPAAAVTRDVHLQAGEIEVLDNVLVNTFGFASNVGGAIAVTTPQNMPLTATARTYNQTTNGTYGQFIPGVTPAESIGLEDRALQILQVEQSPRIRTNIGLSETSGAATTVEVSVILPDSAVTPVVAIDLQPNEFQQISLASFGLPAALYNGRVTVKVIGGSGRVTAYGSAIDQITADPTYVPAL